jgi:hypothetical protein
MTQEAAKKALTELQAEEQARRAAAAAAAAAAAPAAAQSRGSVSEDLEDLEVCAT